MQNVITFSLVLTMVDAKSELLVAFYIIDLNVKYFLISVYVSVCIYIVHKCTHAHMYNRWQLFSLLYIYDIHDIYMCIK